MSSGNRGGGPWSVEPLWLLEHTRVLHGSQRNRQAPEVRAMLKLVELGYFPVIVALSSDPPHVEAESMQVMASGVLEALCHVTHIDDRLQFLDVKPLTILICLLGLKEPVLVTVPLSHIERADLGGIKASHHMYQVPLPPQGHKGHQILHQILACDPPSLFRPSGGRPVPPSSRM